MVGIMHFAQNFDYSILRCFCLGQWNSI